MNKSIQLRLFYILSGLVISIVFIYWSLNSLVLENYYIFEKQRVLIDTYKTINKHYNNNVSDIDLKMEKIDSNLNMDITIINTNELPIYSTTKNILRIGQRNPILIKRFFTTNTEYLVKEDNYVIQKTHDNRLSSYFIELTARLDNGYYVFIRTPLESIRESVKISNKFLIIIGLITISLGTFIIMIIARRLTKPILQLSNIAKSMSKMDFSEKYQVNGEDEINMLGNSINILSDRLEETISQLKSANIQLQRDIDEKSKIDEMRRDFLSSVSHELKTPIALIQGYAEGLKDGIVSDSENMMFYYNVILDESEKMGTLVKRLLTLAQIESSQEPLHIKRFNIVETVNSLLIKKELLFRQHLIYIDFTFKEPIFVWGDEFLIEEVLSNYIMNAIHHVDRHRKIEIKLNCIGNVVKVCVFNTGNHIPKKDMDKVWESFYKVDKSRAREYGGNGLGLSVVAAIMNAHQKNFGVSNIENGVEFWFEIDCIT